MAIIIKTNQPEKLVEYMKSQMNGVLIPTWVVDSDNDFTLARKEWSNKAWFSVQKVTCDEVVLGLISSRIYVMTRELYAVYHGRMTATLLAYFDNIIDTIQSTALPVDYDCIP